MGPESEKTMPEMKRTMLKLLPAVFLLAAGGLAWQVVRPSTSLRDAPTDDFAGQLSGAFHAVESFKSRGRVKAGDSVEGVRVSGTRPPLSGILSEGDFLSPQQMALRRAEPLFRGEFARSPAEVFREGLWAKGRKAIPITWHVIGNYSKTGNPSDGRPLTSWISTSSGFDLALSFVRGQGGGYVYELYPPGGIDVNALYAAYGRKSHIMGSEKEVAFSDHIDPRYIKGAYPVLENRSVGEFIPNPNFLP